jgi:hypothetical protein
VILQNMLPSQSYFCCSVQDVQFVHLQRRKTKSRGKKVERGMVENEEEGGGGGWGYERAPLFTYGKLPFSFLSHSPYRITGS